MQYSAFAFLANARPMINQYTVLPPTHERPQYPNKADDGSYSRVCNKISKGPFLHTKK